MVFWAALTLDAFPRFLAGRGLLAEESRGRLGLASEW